MNRLENYQKKIQSELDKTDCYVQVQLSEEDSEKDLWKMDFHDASEKSRPIVFSSQIFRSKDFDAYSDGFIDALKQFQGCKKRK